MYTAITIAVTFQPLNRPRPSGCLVGRLNAEELQRLDDLLPALPGKVPGVENICRFPAMG